MPVDTTVVRDVVIVLPGIMGSELVDAEGHPVWSVRVGSLARAIRTFGRSIRALTLPPGIGDGHPNDGVRPGSLISSLHVIPGVWSPITGYDGLLNFLRSDRFHLRESMRGDEEFVPNLIPFAYDWRLSNRFNARRLAEVATKALEQWRRQPGMSDAKLVLICHSMGGLIARWFAEQEGGRDLIRTIITIGTPFRGAMKALGTLANGLAPGIGPLRLDLTPFVRSLPSLYQLLPQYECFETDGGRKSLAESGCPGLASAMLSDAFAFHSAIHDDARPAYALHKVVGIRQPTPTTARVSGDLVVTSTTIDGLDQGGDGTVPRLAGELLVGRGREVHEIADQHGELQGTRSLRDLVDGILSRENIVWQASPKDRDALGISMAEVWSTGQGPRLQITNLDDRRVHVTVLDERGVAVGRPVIVRPDGSATLPPLAEGGYRAVVSSATPDGPAPVAKPFVVLNPDAVD